MNKQNAKRLFSSASLLAMLLLTACAAPLTASIGVICPKPAAIPDLSPSLKVPPQRESYLEAAQSDIAGWEQKLTASETR